MTMEMIMMGATIEDILKECDITLEEFYEEEE